MYHLSHVWIGLILVGLGMTVKVILEMQRDMDVLVRERQAYLRSMIECREAITREEDQARGLEKAIVELKREALAIEGEEKNLREKVEALRKKLARPSRVRLNVETDDTLAS